MLQVTHHPQGIQKEYMSHQSDLVNTVQLNIILLLLKNTRLIKKFDLSGVTQDNFPVTKIWLAVNNIAWMRLALYSVCLLRKPKEKL